MDGDRGSTYTVAHAIDTLGFGKFQWLLSAAMGCANIADAMEMMILSILAPALRCQWPNISQVKQASLTTVVFLGMFISSPFWGVMADKYGRRPTLILTSLFLCYFGFLTTFSPTFGWVVFIRFLVGFFIGGIPQSSTLYIEFLPTAARGKAVMVMSFFWAFGACFEAFLAWMVMPTLGWRYLVGFSVLPLIVFLIFTPIIPESLLYLAVSGQKKEAEQLIKRIARINGKPQPEGQLEIADGSGISNRGRIQDLVSSDRRKLTFMVWYLWFVAAGTYYGIVLLSTELLNSNEGVCQGTSTGAECPSTCKSLTDSDFVSLIWTTFAEFPGTILTIFLVDRIGRKKTMSLTAVIFAVATLIVMECALSRTVMVIVLFIARGMSSAFFQVVWVYTPEVYPTNLRAIAMGSGSAAARVGAMITPYVAQVLLKKSLYAAVLVYAAVGFLAAIVSWFLPIETAGVSLSSSDSQFAHKQFENEDDQDIVDDSTAAIAKAAPLNQRH